MSFDPDEGIGPDGTIRTGVDRQRVAPAYEPVLVDAAAATPAEVALYLYGSVATGQATVPSSDVDLLTIGLPATTATELGAVLSVLHRNRCHHVSVAAAQPGDVTADGDASHGLRTFLRHYCVHVAGPDPAADLPAQRAGRAAARGFNGDIAAAVDRWRRALATGADPADLGRTVARRTLLVVAGLVSVHDGTWTTDRTLAAHRWAEVGDERITTLLAWVDRGPATASPVQEALDGVVAGVAEAFATDIGLWRRAPEPDPDRSPPLPLRERDVVRVIVRDADGAVLLAHTRSPDHPRMGTWWELPGGGIEEDESVIAAAAREVREETGLAVEHPRFTVLPWSRVASFPEGPRRHVQHEAIVTTTLDVVRPPLDATGQHDYEQDAHLGFRWWPPARIAAGEATFYPRSLPTALARVLDGDRLDEPLEWWP